MRHKKHVLVGCIVCCMKVTFIFAWLDVNVNACLDIQRILLNACLSVLFISRMTLMYRWNEKIKYVHACTSISWCFVVSVRWACPPVISFYKTLQHVKLWCQCPLCILLYVTERFIPYVSGPITFSPHQCAVAQLPVVFRGVSALSVSTIRFFFQNTPACQCPFCILLYVTVRFILYPFVRGPITLSPHQCAVAQ